MQQAKVEQLQQTLHIQRLMSEEARRNELRAATSSSNRPISSTVSPGDRSKQACSSSNKTDKSKSTKVAPIPPDSSCTEEVCCGDHDHYECERHSHVCVDGMPADAPCDCCRHGHTLSSLIRPDDCKSCLRQMGGTYVSPKYTQIRQKLLKTLNSRRDNSEETEQKCVTQLNCKVNTKKEVITTNSKSPTEDVDALVRMIEGTHINLDPKKVAKKARQKERRIQQQIDEERRKEDEERRKREEEERLRKEKEQQEEEERLKAEELKRVARKNKKKNRKKRSAASEESKSSVSVVTESKSHDESVFRENAKGNKNKMSGTAPVMTLEDPKESSAPDGAEKKSEMVTIRRHPSQPESVVTISLKGKHGGENLLYYLINGQIYRSDENNSETKPPPIAEDTSCLKSSKKKKKKKNKSETIEDSRHSISSSNTNIDAGHAESLDQDNDYSYSQPDDLDLNKRRDESNSSGPSRNSVKDAFKVSENSQFDSNSGVALENRNYIRQCLLEDDIFGHSEDEEFEEVISSKTRRKRIRAAKTKEFDVSEDQESVRSSPCSGISTSYGYTRLPLSASDNLENGGTKRISAPKTTSSIKSGKNKPTRNGKASNGVDKRNPIPNSRREQTYRNTDNYHGSMTMGANVMPRIARAQASSRAAAVGSETQNYSQFLAEPRYSTSRFSEKRKESQYTHVNSDYVNHDSRNAKHMAKEISPAFLNGSSSAIGSQSANQAGRNVWMEPVDRSPLSLGPFTRQSETSKDESSWSPWGASYTEASTPENPSPRFGLESEQSFVPPDTPTNYLFEEFRKRQQSKCPIQRPVPTVGDSSDIHMGMHRDAFSPQQGFNYSPYMSPPSIPRSQSSFDNAPFKRAIGSLVNDIPAATGRNMMTGEYEFPRDVGAIGQPPPTHYTSNGTNFSTRGDNYAFSYDSKKFELADSSRRTYQPSEATYNPSVRNNSQWDAFLDSRTIFDDDVPYNQSTSHSITNPDWSNDHGDESLAIAWAAHHKRVGNMPHIYDGRPYSLLDPQKGAQHMTSPVSPSLPQLPPSDQNWDYGGPYLQNFNSGAQH